MVKLIEFKNGEIYHENDSLIGFNFFVYKDKNVGILGDLSDLNMIAAALNNTASFTNLKLANVDISKNINYLYKRVSVVGKEINFITKTIHQELEFILTNKNVVAGKIDLLISDILKYFGMDLYTNYYIENLSFVEQLMVKIISALIIKPEVLVLNNIFCYLGEYNKNRITEYLKSKSITLLLLTNDPEDTLYTDYIYVFNEKKLVLKGSKIEVLSNEKFLKRLGFGLPFIVDFSLQLKCYQLVNKVFFKNEDLVGELWK